MGKLNQKVAIVTGSTSGIGRAIAERYALEGAKVLITGRNEERAKTVLEGIKEKGGEAAYVLADTNDLNSPKIIFDECMRRFGTVDILVKAGCGTEIRDSRSGRHAGTGEENDLFRFINGFL